RRFVAPATLVVTLVGASLLAGASPAAASDRHPHRRGETHTTDTSIPQTPIAYPFVRSRSVLSAATMIRFSDLDASEAWAKPAIRWVAATNTWMRDYAANGDGSYPFRPGRIETRKQLARAIVEAFAPDEVPDASIVFPDLDASSSWYRYAAIAVEHGWI